MILTPEQITNIIINNPNAALVLKGQKYNIEMRRHFYGDRLSDELEAIDGFEKPTLRNLRVKYAKSNKDLMARLSRPLDKIFSARGGSIYYNLPEVQDKKARELVKDVRGGVSVKKWIENTWKAHYLDDPYGLVFMEIAKPQQVALLKQRGKSFVYPTYQSIQGIYDYLPIGSNLEYVVFKLDKNQIKEAGLNPDDQIYRVVDDAFDYYVKRVDNDRIEIMQDHTFPNYFMQVPAIRNSDIPDPNCEGGVLSLFDPIIELAKEFLLKGSIKVTHTFMHGFPKYWEYASDCNHCGGTGLFEAENCKSCNGTGKNIMTKVSDNKLLSFPQSKEDAIVTPDIAGYVEPSKIYYEIATHDLNMLEDVMTFTLWGASSAQKTQGMAMDGKSDTQTATQIMNEIKPQADRLTFVSQCAESRHKFIIDGVVGIQISQNYKGANVNYGNRYMLEGPDELLLRYMDQKMKGASVTLLDSLLLEYYEAAYFNDPIELAIKIKLMKVEPAIHYTVEQVKATGYDEEYTKKKMYFGDWKKSLTQGELLAYTTEQLEQNLTKYVSTKTLPVPIDERKLLMDSKKKVA